MIFASDVMTNGGYVVPRNTVLTGTDPLDDYFITSIHLSFLNYFDEFLCHTCRKNVRGSHGGEVRSAGIEEHRGVPQVGH